MKRTLTIATLCVLLLATIGTTAAVAEQKEKSSVYHFDIKASDSHGPGKLTINLNKHTFVFTGKGFRPDTRYWLWCEALDHAFGSVVANSAGNVNFQGTWPQSIPTVPATTAFALIPSLPTGSMTASFTASFHRYSDADHLGTWEIDASSSTGPIYRYELNCYYKDTAGNDANGFTGSWGPAFYIQLKNIGQRTPVIATLTVYDASGSHVTSQDYPLPWPYPV